MHAGITSRFVENFTRPKPLSPKEGVQRNWMSPLNDPTNIAIAIELWLKNYFIFQGDSGGPLVCRYNNDRWTLAGVASFTSANNPESFPGVFTRVTEYVDWIEDVIIDDYFKEHYPDSEWNGINGPDTTAVGSMYVDRHRTNGSVVQGCVSNFL